MKDIIIETKDLTYIYPNNNNVALDKISVRIKENEKIVVLGSNGAGKSTFFLNLNGVLKPQSGTIIYRGQEINHSREQLFKLRKNIGIVFQEPDSQIIASTVLGEVSFGPMNLKLPKSEVIKRVDEALEYMNISEFKNRAPHYLSGGEKKKVSIADIIAMKPEIIILDEPTASLDPFNTEALDGVINKLSSQGTTMIISTHDVNFAYRFAERILVFSKGKIIADDTPINIFNNEELLKEANLKTPILYDAYRILLDNNLVKDNMYPKDIEEFKKIVSESSDRNGL